MIVQCTSCKHNIHKQCIAFISVLDYIKFNEDRNWISILCLENVFPFYHIIDDTDFNDCFQRRPLNGFGISLDELNERRNDSCFEISEDHVSDPLHDVDPDAQFYQNIPNLHNGSNFYDSESFNNKNYRY